MSSIRIVGEDGTVPEEKPQELVSQDKVSSPVVQEVQVNAIVEALDLDKVEKSRYADNIDTLLQYARSATTDHSPEGLKWAIRDLEIKLGSPPLSEKRIVFLSRYAYLMAEKAKTEKELKNFEKANK